MISIIIPTLNESEAIRPCLADLQGYRHHGHEIIVVDGGSIDDTIAQAQELCDHIITARKGRSKQMNTGAAIAQGDILLFLHADTKLPTNAETLIHEGTLKHSWGHFKIRIDGKQRLFRIIETLMNWRSRLSHIATGDQALFIRHPLFKDIHGFPEIAIMEDIAISKRLKSTGHRPFFITSPAITSCRRWQQRGILRTIVLMWYLRLAYYLGSHPATLAKKYL